MIRVGIVDDEKQERDQLKQALARFGAENGTELCGSLSGGARP